MAGYALLGGLGDALQQIGGSVFKSKFLDKLKEKEQVRAEQREQQRKDAERAKNVATTRFVNKDGVWYEQKLNADRQVVDEQLAPKSDIDRLNRDEQKEKQGLEESLLKIGKLKREESYAEEDRGLEKRFTEAKIRTEEAQGDYYRMGGSAGARASAKAEEEASGSPEDYVEELLKQSKGLEQQYVGGKNPVMTYSQYENVARNAVMEGAKRGVDPRSTFAEILRRYVQDPRFMKPKSAALDDEEL